MWKFREETQIVSKKIGNFHKEYKAVIWQDSGLFDEDKECPQDLCIPLYRYKVAQSPVIHLKSAKPQKTNPPRFRVPALPLSDKGANTRIENLPPVQFKKVGNVVPILYHFTNPDALEKITKSGEIFWSMHPNDKGIKNNYRYPIGVYATTIFPELTLTEDLDPSYTPELEIKNLINSRDTEFPFLWRMETDSEGQFKFPSFTLKQLSSKIHSVPGRFNDFTCFIAFSVEGLWGKPTHLINNLYDKVWSEDTSSTTSPNRYVMSYALMQKNPGTYPNKSAHKNNLSLNDRIVAIGTYKSGIGRIYYKCLKEDNIQSFSTNKNQLNNSTTELSAKLDTTFKSESSGQKRLKL